MIYRSSSQSFKFDIPLCITYCEQIRNSGKIDVGLIGQFTGTNIPKINENISYLRFCDLIKDNQISSFGTKILYLKNNPEFVEPLLLYKLSRGCENGGHYYFSRLVNDVLYNIAFEVLNYRTLGDILNLAILSDKESEYCKDKDKKLYYRQALRMGLADATTGFGKMGMVVNNNDSYEISGYIPHKLITGYILYDNWPVGRSALKITEIIYNDYLPGKIFFLGRDIINQQLHELALDKIISIEQEAGLDQIRLNPQLTANDILDRMVNLAN